MKYKNLGVNTLFILIFLFMINQILITSISTYFNTDEATYEVSRNVFDFKIKYRDLKMIEDTLNAETVFVGDKTTSINTTSNNETVKVKGIYGNYEKYFKSRVTSGRFIKDSDDGRNKGIVISSNMARELFNQGDVVGLKFEKDNSTTEVLGVYEENIFDIFKPEEVEYIHLIEMMDKEGNVPIEALYINKKDKEGEPLQENYINSVLGSYGISPDSYTIGDFNKSLNFIYTLEVVLIFFIMIFMMKDIYDIFLSRAKNLTVNIKNNGVRSLSKESVSIEILIMISGFAFVVYLFKTVNYTYLPIELILKEDIITLQFYVDSFKNIWINLFNASNDYTTSKGYFLKLVTTITTINYIIILFGGMIFLANRNY